MAIGTHPRDGLSSSTLQDAVKRAGWVLGAGRAKLANGEPVAWLDPLCPACGRKLVDEITDDGRAPMTPEARLGLAETGMPARGEDQ